jgi:perosamine synthetase
MVPVNNDFLPFHVPEIGDEEIQSVVETLRSGWLTTGAKVKQLEENFAKYVRAAHGVAVNSGTAALHLALEAFGIKERDEVIVPTMTFTASAEVVLYLKARPVLVDCDPVTLNIDADKIEEKITGRTKAIMPVHLAGLPCEMAKIRAIANRHKLRIVEDAAHALPAVYDGQMVGAIGDITCFSFYVTKTITTGEGGMATTNNPEWADRMRMMSLHGISKDAWNRYSSEGSWFYEVLFPGYKYNMTDIAAALGVEQLKKCDRFRNDRRRIAEAYTQGFADYSEIQTPVFDANLEHAWHLYIIQLELERLSIDRNSFIEALKQKNIGTSVHFIPLHLHPYYRSTFAYTTEDFPRASAAFKRIISLPIFPKMSNEDVARVITTVRDLVRQHRR